MKNKMLIFRTAFALFLLIGGGLFIAQTSSAARRDCLQDRWNAFLNANSLFSRAFNYRHHGQPINCNPQQNYPHCSNVCSANPSSPQCVSCRNACDIDNQNQDPNQVGVAPFGFAQDYLITTANQICNFEPEYCDNARYQESICRNNRNARWENPVYIETKQGPQIDDEWFSDVTEEYMACRAASGVDNCE